MPTKVCTVKAMVFPVVTYSCENWTIKNGEQWRIDGFELWCRQDSWESLGLQGGPISQSYRKLVLNIDWKDWCWSWNSSIWPPDVKNWLIGKDPDAGKDWRREEKGTTEDEMVGWHQWLSGYEFGWTPGVGDGQGGLVCCSPCGRKESDTTEWLNWTVHCSAPCLVCFSMYLGDYSTSDTEIHLVYFHGYLAL